MSYILDALRKSEVERQRNAEQDNTSEGIRPPQPAKYAASKRLPLFSGIVFLLIIATTVFFLVITKNDRTSKDLFEQPVTHKATTVIEAANVVPESNERQESAPTQISEELKTYKTLPFFWAKPVAYRQGINPFSVSIHVYAENPAQRILFINNREYRVGEQTLQGPRIESIEPQGVILSYRGEYFKLPRPR